MQLIESEFESYPVVCSCGEHIYTDDFFGAICTIDDQLECPRCHSIIDISMSMINSATVSIGI